MRFIFLGPGAARLEKGKKGRGTRPGNAAIVGQTEVTPQMIAYVCVQVSQLYLIISYAHPRVFSTGSLLYFDNAYMGRSRRRLRHETFLLQGNILLS